MVVSTTIYDGDLLQITTSGTVEPASSDAGSAVIGVAAEYKVSPSTGETYVSVYDDPLILFGIQADSGTALSATDVGKSANHVAGSGSTTTRLSGHELDADDIGIGGQLTIVNRIDQVDNAWGEHVEVMVLIKEHRLGGIDLNAIGDSSELVISEICIVSQAAGITKGDVVYASGATGGFMQVSLADNTDHDKAHVYGIAAEDKSNGEQIFIRQIGAIDNLDTSSYSEGDRMHLITAGQWQTAVPTNGAHIHLGFIKKSNANTGSISVHIEDFVHDIAAAAGQNLEMRMGDAAGSNKILFKDYAGVEVGSIDSDGDATFVDVNFTDSNGTENSLADLDHHVKDLNEDLATTKFAVTGATSGGVYTITATSSDSPVETLEGVIEGKELTAAGSSEAVAVESLKGTDASPNNVYVYFKNDGADVLEIAASNTSPDGGVVEHIDGVYMKLGSVAGSSSNVYAVNNINAFANAKLEGILDRFKEQGTLYKTGMAITSDANSIAITTGTARHVVSSVTTPALEVDSVTPVDNYFYIQNGGTWVTETDWSIAQYSDGVSFASPQRMKVRLGICIDNPELTSARWFAMPQNGATTYNTAAQAWLDASNMAVTTPSDDIVKYAFIPIADVVIRNNAGTYTLEQDPNTSLYHRDARGTTAGGGAGGGAAAQNVYETFIGDSGTTTASSSSDTLDIEGGTGITTTASSDKVTVAADDSIAKSAVGLPVVEWSTDVAVSDGQFYLHIPAKLNGMNLVTVHAEVITAGTTGTTDIQIYNVTQTADMLSTKLTIDSGETGSDTAATPAVIDTANDDVATNDLLRVDVDAISTTAPKGLLVTLEFALP
jgi:hypothetical protein